MKIQNVLKVIMALLAILGGVLGYFERKYAPQPLLAESSPQYPEWLSWLGYWMLFVSAIGYALIDLVVVFIKKKKEKREGHQPANAP